MPNESKENQTLSINIAELGAKIEMLLERQEEMAENVAKIKEAIYNPDQGLYARLRELENWKQEKVYGICSDYIGLWNG